MTRRKPPPLDLVSGAFHNIEWEPGIVAVGHIMTEDEMRKQYAPILKPSYVAEQARLYPSDKPRWESMHSFDGERGTYSDWRCATCKPEPWR
jgi:hypothetical protein